MAMSPNRQIILNIVSTYWWSFLYAIDWAVLSTVDADGAWRSGLWVDSAIKTPDV